MFLCGKKQVPSVSIQHMESLYEVNPDKVSLDSLQRRRIFLGDISTAYTFRLVILLLRTPRNFQDSNYQKVYTDIKNTFADFEVYEQELTELKDIIITFLIE